MPESQAGRGRAADSRTMSHPRRTVDRMGGHEPSVVRLAGQRYRCHHRWRQLGQKAWAQRWVSVGQIIGGRWYVQVVSQVHTPARGYPDPVSAYAAAQRIKAELTRRHGGGWEEVPCYPTQAALATSQNLPSRIR